MSRVSSLAVLAFVNVAVAQTPYVHNLYVPHPATFQMQGPFDFTDIPGSDQTLTIPAGKAFITWSFIAVPGETGSRVRPVIGDAFPSEGIAMRGGRGSGSWITATEGGPVTVKFQAAGGSFEINSSLSFTWTLFVFPDQPPGPVPAVGGIGLAVLTVLILGLGAVLIRKRQSAA